MPRNFARVISVLFQPLLLSIYAVFLLLYMESWMLYFIGPRLKYALFIIVAVTTFVMPALTVVMFLQRGTINSLEMETREERNWPYLVTLIFYAIGWYLLYRLPLQRVFSCIIMGAQLAILIAFLINLRWKISIHLMGLGGLAGMFFAFAQLFNYQLTIPIAVIVAVAGITGTARLSLNAHTPAQVYTGFLLGFGVEWIFVFIYNLWPYYFN